MYFNVKKNIIPCSDNTKFTCEQLHDKMLGDSINDNKTIVVEINGDKDFSWLFVDSTIEDNLFTNEHRKQLRENYDITICYLSHDFEGLLKSNKERFLETINKCKNICRPRLGNFLIPIIYNETITNIFKIYNKLLNENLFNKFNIKTLFYERDSNNNYVKLSNFNEYQKSFNLPITSQMSKTNYYTVKQYTVKLAIRGRRKSKKPKAKKINKYKKLKLL